VGNNIPVMVIEPLGFNCGVDVIENGIRCNNCFITWYAMFNLLENHNKDSESLKYLYKQFKHAFNRNFGFKGGSKNGFIGGSKNLRSKIKKSGKKSKRNASAKFRRRH